MLIAGVGAEIDHHWVISTKYPRHQIEKSEFEDSLGHGEQLRVTHSGLMGQPNVVCIVRLYDALAYGDLRVSVQNKTARPVTVQAIRSVDAVGEPRVDLGGPPAADRVLSDTFSDYNPTRRNPLELARAAGGVHRGVGSQLLYNKESQESLFLGALTSERFLTILRLLVHQSTSGGPSIASYVVDSTGTTELEKESILRGAPVEDQIELSLPVRPGAELPGERLLFAVGRDYHAQLEQYGRAIRVLHHARVSGPNLMGWWSWTAYYAGISESTALTNARWLSEHLKKLGYNCFHIDEGYEYARGEYATANAAQFPHGMRRLGHQLCELGLTFAIWTAPFEVSSRAWVYEHHQDWLVRNAQGQPIRIGDPVLKPGQERLYVLDTTNPGAQDYLRQTYKKLAREWGVRYIKLDFMDNAAIEGYRYRPNTTALEAQRIGLKAIRQAVGDEVLLDKDGSPMLNPVGYVDEGRISCDTGHSFQASKDAALGIASRYYMNRNFYVSDPDAFTVTRQLIPEEVYHQSKAGLTLSEAEVSIVLAAVSGGMYEIGDDLPILESEPHRLELVENPELIEMVKVGRAAVPLDLMTFRKQDEQPSVFWLREDRRQGVLAVFNWTEEAQSHAFRLEELKLPTEGHVQAYDVLKRDQPVPLEGVTLRLQDQQAHSVRLIKLVDSSLPKAVPVVTATVPTEAHAGTPVKLCAATGSDETPALEFRWTFGDGTYEDGAEVTHAYTQAGTYTVRLKVGGVDGIASEQSFPIVIKGFIRTRFDLSHNRRYHEPSNP